MTYKVVVTEDLTVISEQVAGIQGAGVATGGSTGQVLAKTSSTDYATGWVNAGTVTNVSGTSPISVATGTTTPTISLATTLPTVTSVNSTTIPASSTLVTTATTSLANLTSVNSTTIPASSTLVTTATTSLANLTSVNSTTIPASSTLVTTATTSQPNTTSVNSTTIPASSTLVTSSNYRQSQLTPSGAVDIIPRLQVSGTRVVNAGTIAFTGFTPVADMTLSKISVNITAVSGTPTLQFGVYSISAMTATCLGSSSVSSAISTSGLVELSLTSSVSLTAGTNYLIAFLPVGGTSATFSGANINNSAGLQGNGTSGVFAPLIAAQSSSTTKTAMTTVGSTETLSGTVVAGFVFARLNNS